jgi:hypothetical protein
MKTYPVFNQVPRHEDVCGNGGIAPRILNPPPERGGHLPAPVALPPTKKPPVPIIFGEGYNYEALHSLSFSLLGPNILPSTKFSDTLNNMQTN